MPSLSEQNEDAVIAFIQDTGSHGETLGIVPRRFNHTKFDNTGSLTPLVLPATIVQARQLRQLHAQLGVWQFLVETTLVMQGDDTNQEAWDNAARALETIFSVDDLKGYLTDAISGYWCGGIESRNLGGKTITGRSWRRTYGVMLWASRME